MVLYLLEHVDCLSALLAGHGALLQHGQLLLRDGHGVLEVAAELICLPPLLGVPDGLEAPVVVERGDDLHEESGATGFLRHRKILLRLSLPPQRRRGAS